MELLITKLLKSRLVMYWRAFDGDDWPSSVFCGIVILGVISETQLSTYTSRYLKFEPDHHIFHLSMEKNFTI